MAKHAVAEGLQRTSTRRVDRRPTKPRAGSSNLSGRTSPSENSTQTRVTTFIARAMACGLSEVGARRLLSAQRLIARSVAAGRMTVPAGVIAAQRTALTLLRLERAA